MIVLNTLKSSYNIYLKDNRKSSVVTTNRFFVLSPDENPTDSMENDSSLDGGCERSTQIDDSKSNHRTTSYQKTNTMPGKK